jgi:hypothetical protein
MIRKNINLSFRGAIIFLIVWLLAASLLSDFWPFIRSEGEWATISHTEYGLAIDYPTKWVAKKSGEFGYKGATEEKLRVYPSFLSDTYIYFYYKTSSDPTLDRVVDWGDSMMNRFRDNIGFEESPLEEGLLRGQPIVRRRYKFENFMFEDVHIVRPNDMIIITMQSSITDFDKDYDEFEAIVASFRPLD